MLESQLLRDEGEAVSKISIAKNLIAMDMALEAIAQVTGLSLAFLVELVKKPLIELEEAMVIYRNLANI